MRLERWATRVGPALTCLLLGGCSGGTPACDGKDVSDAVKSALIERAGLVREKPEFFCVGGCSPYLDRDNVQFISLQTDRGGRIARSLSTFSVKSKDFFDAIETAFSGIRVLEKNADVRAVACAAKVSTKINFTTFDQALLSKEIVNFRNFDGNVTGWHTQREVQSTIRQELESQYSTLLWVSSVEYVAQYTTDGKLYVKLD